MADITIDLSIWDNMPYAYVWRTGIHWVSATVGYAIYKDFSTGNIVYAKTINGGLNWGAPQAIFAGNATGIDCWVEWQTPGDTGTRILISACDATSSQVIFAYLDTFDDSVGFTNIEACQGTGTMFQINPLYKQYFFTSITKSCGGRIYVSYRYADNSLAYFYNFAYSGDNGASFNLISDLNLWEGAHTDWATLYPANLADPDDIWAVFGDDSAGQYDLKTYDASLDTWSIVNICTMVNVTITSQEQKCEDGDIRQSDGVLFFAALNDQFLQPDTADIETYMIDGAGSITQMTNVKNGTEDGNRITSVSLLVDQLSLDVYCGYLWGGWHTTPLAYYKKSSDEMASWGAETAYGVTGDDYRTLDCGSYNPANGGLFALDWMDDDDYDLITNIDNAVTIGPGIFGGNPPMQSLAVKKLLGAF